MATTVQSIIEADKAAIRAHLEELFSPAREEYPKGIFELCYGSERLDRHAYFGLSPEQMDEATSFIANRNAEGSNCYVGVNPRKPTTDRRHSAKDVDVEIAFWHFADLDSKAAAENARLNMPVRPTMVVMTGTVPHDRPHLYWRLEEPVGNMAAWTERQRGIAQSLSGDSVIDPRRIMRLAGTVNFPTPAKLVRGYRTEVTQLRTKFNSEREPVSPEQISKAFPAKVYSTDAVVGNGETTLSSMRSTQISDIIDACRSGDGWHNQMIRLVAHLASKGRSSVEIMAMADHITLPGYTVQETQRDMAAALRSARIKWDLPEPVEESVENEEASREAADSVFEILNMDELEALPPPTWLIHELIADHGLSVIYGDPGTGKSFIALDMALRVAMGLDWHGTEASQAGVLYIAGEGARGLGKRIKGWRRHHALEGVEAPFLLLPMAVQMLDAKERSKLIRTIDAAKERAGFPIGLVVIDTVSRALSGAVENSQEAMSEFVSACAQVQAHTGGAVLAIHHSGKDKDRGMRGSTVLLGGCDASIQLTKDEQTVKLKIEKQKDAEEAQPVNMTLKKIEWATGFEPEQSTLVPIKSEPSLFRDRDGMTTEKIERAFDIVQESWADGNPLSMFTAAKSAGRYAPSVISSVIEVPSKTVERYLIKWQENGQMETVKRTNGKEKSGLKVNRRLNNGS